MINKKNKYAFCLFSSDDKTIIINDKFKIKIETINKILFDLYLLTLKPLQTTTTTTTKKNVAQQATSDNNLNYRSFKLVEQNLYEIFDKCDEPAWLNLLLIEHSKDYHVNKINTHAVMISKSFEKWCFKSINKMKINFNFDLKLNAFKLAIKHHTLLLESIVKSYDLDQIQNELYPYVVKEIERFDYKDKAVCISSLAMQHLFDIKTV